VNFGKLVFQSDDQELSRKGVELKGLQK